MFTTIRTHRRSAAVVLTFAIAATTVSLASLSSEADPTDTLTAAVDDDLAPSDHAVPTGPTSTTSGAAEPDPVGERPGPDSRQPVDRPDDDHRNRAAQHLPSDTEEGSTEEPGEMPPLGVLELDPDAVERSPRPPGSAAATTDMAATPNPGPAIDVVDGDIKTGPGCSIQCITSGVAYARGVNAELVLQTDTPATVVLTIWNGDGLKGYANSTPHRVTELRTTLDDLEPGTTYQVLASATDAAGHESQAYGEFTTLRRNVSVSYSYVELPGTTTIEHLDTHIRLDEVWIGSYFGDEVEDAIAHIGFHQEQLMDAPRHLDLTFQVARHSQGSPCEPAAWYFPRVEGGHGEVAAACRVYATSQQGAIDLDARPAGASSWIQHTLELERSSDTGIPFSVPVVVQVNYVP